MPTETKTRFRDYRAVGDGIDVMLEDHWCPIALAHPEGNRVFRATMRTALINQANAASALAEALAFFVSHIEQNKRAGLTPTWDGFATCLWKAEAALEAIKETT